MSTKKITPPPKITYFFFFILLSCFGTVSAQPGWEDFTKLYFYTISDEKGSMISFRESKEYSVAINDIVYSGPNIPTDSLRPVSPGASNFDNYIRINDLSLRFPQDSRAPVVIKIIHKKDTMHINQPSGRGTAGLYFEEKNKKRDWGRKLRFIPGHYYFPGWVDQLLDNLPETGGNVRILNSVQQHNFLVPAVIYTSASQTSSNSYISQSGAEETIIGNFMKGWFAVDKRIEPTSISPSLLPYRRPRLEGDLHPTPDSNIYVGMIGYALDTLNCHSSKNAFGIFNTGENTITHWLPGDNINLSRGISLYNDTFNGILYQIAGVRENFKPDQSDCNNTPYTQIIYSSNNYGKTWSKHRPLQKLFDKYLFRELEFLDKDHALGFTLKENKKNNIRQGGYYLIRNMKVIDSLITPDDIHYNTNHTRYSFSKKGDTIHLGHWGLDEQRLYGDTYFSPLLLNQGDNWIFTIKETIFQRGKNLIPKDTVVQYKNFVLTNDRELVFNNGSGSLTLTRDVVKEPWKSGVYVLEKDDQIYLLHQNSDYHDFILMSFNGGSSWYVYPTGLAKRGDYTLLEINEQNIISYFDRWKMHKVFHLFSPL